VTGNGSADDASAARVYAESGRHPADSVHPIVRIGAEWTWRLLVLAAGVAVLAFMVAKLDTVLIPIGLALLGSGLLSPLVDWMHRRGIPRVIAVVVALLGSIGVVAGILTFVVQQFVEGVPQLGDQFTTSIQSVQNWLTDGPFHFSEDQIRSAGDSVVRAIQSNQEALTSGALTTAAVIGEIFTGLALMLFTLIFFLYGGNQIWQFVTRLAPTPARRRIRIAGIQAFTSLVGYIRATVAVAAVDAIGIGAGLAILGVPLALPLASLVFIGAFIPIVGALLTGFVAVFIALVTKGLITAVIALAVVVGVMQVEGHVLQPLFLGRAVRLHPLAVVVAIATGIVLAGIIGGLLAVPIVAMVNTAVRSLMADDPEAAYEGIDASEPMFPADPDSPHPSTGMLEAGTITPATSKDDPVD
jgi:predicted PurR-regulated permease PerM